MLNDTQQLSIATVSEKTCSTCKGTFGLDAFYKNKHMKDGLTYICKTCSDKKSKAWAQSHVEELRAYRERNKEKRATENKKWCDSHKLHRVEYRKAGYRAFLESNPRPTTIPVSPEHSLARRKEWRLLNIETIRIQSKERYSRNREKLCLVKRQYYAANRERLIEYSKSYTENHREETRAYHKIYAEQNKGTLSIKQRQRYKTNPERYKTYAKVSKHRRRVREASAGSFTAAEWREICARYGFICLCCGDQKTLETLSVDHVIPISRGGSNTADNLQPLCLHCNLSKGTKTVDYRV